MWGGAVRCQFLRRTSLRRRHQFFVTFYVRRLPHWQPPDADFFVTWRLYGSLPRYSARLVLASAPHGKAFVALDRQLDTADSGPLWMKNQEVAAGVSRILLAGVSPWQLYELLAWVVMANHVHVLLRPRVSLRKALMNVKSASARAANAILGRTGQPFWQDESYDHWVRGDRERASITSYIEHNPVTAGLAPVPGDYPWSSAGWQRMALPHICAQM